MSVSLLQVYSCRHCSRLALLADSVGDYEILLGNETRKCHDCQRGADEQEAAAVPQPSVTTKEEEEPDQEMPQDATDKAPVQQIKVEAVEDGQSTSRAAAVIGVDAAGTSAYLPPRGPVSAYSTPQLNGHPFGFWGNGNVGETKPYSL